MEDIKYWIWLSKLNLAPANLKKCLEDYSPKDIWDIKNNIKDFFTKEELNRIKNKDYKKE